MGVLAEAPQYVVCPASFDRQWRIDNDLRPFDFLCGMVGGAKVQLIGERAAFLEERVVR